MIASCLGEIVPDDPILFQAHQADSDEESRMINIFEEAKEIVGLAELTCGTDKASGASLPSALATGRWRPVANLIQAAVVNRSSQESLTTLCAGANLFESPGLIGDPRAIIGESHDQNS